MPTGSLVWNEIIDRGSALQFVFTITALDGSPYPMDSVTWEYVLRKTTGVEVCSITTTPSGNGKIVVTSTDELSQVTLTIDPAATADLATGAYQHALWMNPGTANAYPWAAGSLQINSVSQP